MNVHEKYVVSQWLASGLSVRILLPVGVCDVVRLEGEQAVVRNHDGTYYNWVLISEIDFSKIYAWTPRVDESRYRAGLAGDDPKAKAKDNLLGDPFERALQKLDAAAGPRRNQIYQHYKGGLYVVTSVSIDEETLSPIVSYASEDHPHEIDTSRPMAVFLETLAAAETEAGRVTVPRFRRYRR